MNHPTNVEHKQDSPPGSRRDTPTGQPRGSWRGDIQALRALAVVAVVLYHFDIPQVRGGFIGVDIFFVVSGYLVGGSLVRELREHGRIRWATFLAKRARRILPASLAVVAATLLASVVLLSPLRLAFRSADSVVNDAIATVLYVPNLWFAHSGNDYLSDSSRSPLLHYWSLGVEEQFYVAAPVILTLVWWLTRRRYRAALLGVGVLTVTSAAYGLSLATTDSVNSFYQPGARAWELSIGLLVSTLPVLGTRYRTLGRALTWGAVAVLISAVFWVSSDSAWPNGATVIVVAASAVALWAGRSTHANKQKPLGRLVEGIGDRSYSIYLWHWPLVVLVPAAVGHELGPRTAVATAIAMLVLSEFSYRYIETPLRRLPVKTSPSRRRIFKLALVSMAGVLALAVMIGLVMPRTMSSSGPIADTARIGTGPPEFATILPYNIRPTLASAKRGDVPRNYHDDCHVPIEGRSNALEPCVYGSGGPTLALFGDSHAAQWLPALEPFVDNGDITVVSLTASWCTPMPVIEYPDDHFDNCEDWRSQAVDYLKENPPDYLVMSAFLSRAVAGSDPDGAKLARSLETMYDELPAGPQMSWIADTAQFPQEPPECAAEHPQDLAQCAVSREQARQGVLDQVAQTQALKHGVAHVDMNDLICDPDTCGIVTGDVLIYRDDHHISGTYATALSQALGRDLELVTSAPSQSASP